jgi:hypothetical protein
MASRKTLWIVLISAGVVVLLGVAFVGTVAYVVMHNLEIRPTPAATAEREYDEVRDRFQCQAPLIELDPDHFESFRVHKPAERPPSGKVEKVRIFAWTPREGKVVRLAIPIWLLRMNPGSGTVNWNLGGDLEMENLKLTVEDIERYGPGLILDLKDHKGARVIVWSE